MRYLNLSTALIISLVLIGAGCQKKINVYETDVKLDELIVSETPTETSDEKPEEDEIKTTNSRIVAGKFSLDFPAYWNGIQVGEDFSGFGSIMVDDSPTYEA
ncbi:MAG: hypothetical protein ABH846_02240, partial [Patescibacteria group bacterium]